MSQRESVFAFTAAGSSLCLEVENETWGLQVSVGTLESSAGNLLAQVQQLLWMSEQHCTHLLTPDFQDELSAALLLRYHQARFGSSCLGWFC